MSRSSASSFVQGNAGQTYVRKHIQSLLKHGFVVYECDTSGDYVEGGDSRVTYYRFGKEANLNDFSLDGVINIQGTGNIISAIEVGGLEVKTINSFTFRTNDNNEQTGTLPFELWNRDRYGWLLALLYPELRLESEEIHAVQPVLFSYLLVTYLGPYACIMFEDFSSFVQRLKELAEEKGFELIPQSEEHPDGIPLGETETWRQDDPYIIDNCWHIPFDRLSDLATVTMIGDMPIMKSPTNLKQNDDYLYLQQNRYHYLLECADGRMIPEEIESRTDFYPVDETHLYADILYNMDITDNLKQEE